MEPKGFNKDSNESIKEEENMMDEYIKLRDRKEHSVINITEHKIEDLLNKWRLESLQFSDKHSSYSKEYALKGKILTLISIVCSSGVGISAFVSREEWSSVLIGSISLISAILQGLLKYLKFESLEFQHKQLSIKYYNVANDILYEMTKNPDRIDKILDGIKFKLENLLKASPSGL